MALDSTQFLFLLLLFIVAFIYASVGHGGASGYLALMAIFSVSPDFMRSSALMLNIVVSLIAFYQFYKKGFFKWSVFQPFAIASIPAAYIGAQLDVDPFLYKKVLGIFLLFPAFRLLGLFGFSELERRPNVRWLSLLVGALIGFFSGMIGIGGGVLLSPILLLLGWVTAKQAAGISALFIFVNSVAGLVGFFVQGVDVDSMLILWVFVAFVGGYLGSRYTTLNMGEKSLKRFLAVTLLLASIKLLFF